MDVEKHLLIVDRNELLVQALSLAVAGGGTWKVTQALHYEDVLDLVQNTPIRVILMGYRVDGGMGMNLARELRSRGFSRSIVLMSGSVKSIDRVEAARLGIHRILSKPFSIGLVYEVIEESYSESLELD